MQRQQSNSRRRQRDPDEKEWTAPTERRVGSIAQRPNNRLNESPDQRSLLCQQPDQPVRKLIGAEVEWQRGVREGVDHVAAEIRETEGGHRRRSERRRLCL